MDVANSPREDQRMPSKRKQPQRETYLARIAFEGSASIHEVEEEDGMIVAIGSEWKSQATTVEELVRDLNRLVDLIGDTDRFIELDDQDMITEEAREMATV
jgi:hypothetical protein